MTYQLSCGHWTTERRADLLPGDVLPCRAHDTLRTTVIGWSP